MRALSFLRTTGAFARDERGTSFARDERGNATVEFVIVFPLLVLWLAISLMFFDAFRSNSQTEKTAFTASDILSRYEDVDATDVSFVQAMVIKMLPPRADQRRFRVTSICYEDDTYKVLWSHHWKDGDVTEAFGDLTDETIPTEIMPDLANQDSIILTEVYARWNPLSNWGALQPQTWANALVTRPRFSQIVPHATLNPSTTCPRIVE